MIRLDKFHDNKRKRHQKKRIRPCTQDMEVIVLLTRNEYKQYVQHIEKSFLRPATLLR